MIHNKVWPSWKGADKDSVRHMFNSIAKRYDLLNHLLSCGIDKRWRLKLMKLIKESSPLPKKDKDQNEVKLLDVATGTGDLLLTLVENSVANRFFGVDISANMLNFAQEKLKKQQTVISQSVDFSLGDAEKLHFPDDYFTFITVAFGVRNFENLYQGLSEMYRTLKVGGKVFILEFSIPRNLFVRGIYFFYFSYILPFIGGLISRNRFAYKYLPDSVSKFPCGKDFCDILSEVGFSKPKVHMQTFGIASIYEATKSSSF